MSRQAVFAVFYVLLAARISQAAFVHPGCLSTQTDLDRMAAKVAANEEPWKGGYDRLVNNNYSHLGHNPSPQVIVYVSGSQPDNYMNLARDAASAYQAALRYHASGDPAYAEKAISTLMAWAKTHTSWDGNTNVSLRAGLYGYQLACAGELVRDYPGWSAADFNTFKSYVRNLFYKIVSPNDVDRGFLFHHHGTCWSHYWANWELAAMATVIATGVLLDDQAIFDEAIDYFYNGVGVGRISELLHYRHPNGLGQSQEFGRDQGHATMLVPLLGTFCEIAWNQGVDLYSELDNAFLSMSENLAKYNLWYDVPYVTYVNCEYWIMTNIGSGQGAMRPGWDMIYNHYVNRRGLATPYSKIAADQMRPDGGGGDYGGDSGGFDQLGFTTLTHSLDPIASGAVPGALLPYIKGRQITLSWKGSAYATSYNVKRSTSSGGPYTTLAIVDDKNLYYVDPGLTNGTTYYYVVSANNPGGESANSTQVAATANGQLYGTVIGTDGSWDNRGARKECVFDGSLKNFFDAPDSVSWAGLDLGSGVSAVITQVKYCPRAAFSSRMVGGKFQGSNTADFSSGVTDLFTISSGPADGVLTSQTISNGNAFRYVRYLGPSGGYGNVAEVQFLGNVTGLSAPSTPGGLTATVDSATQVTLAWNSVSGAESYNVKRATVSGGPYTIVANVDTWWNLSCSDDDLTPGKTYYYTVSALNSTGQSVNSSEVIAVTPVLLINVALGCTASASDDNDEWNSAEVAASAFDGSVYTKWYTGGNTGYAGWLQADLGSGNAQAVTRYDISSANDVQNRDPKNWQLLASNNGSTWTTLDTRSGQVFANRYQTNQYTISNSTAYRYYRLNITSNYSGSAADGIQLSELALMAQVPTFTSGSINNLDGVEARDYTGNALSNYVTVSGGTFSKAGGAGWLTVASDGTLSGVPLHSNVGENTFTVRVDSAGGLFDTASMTIQVANTYSGTQGMSDLLNFTAQWLMLDCADFPACDGADLDGDNDVTFSDFTILGHNWLEDGAL